MFSREELERYNRHLILPEIGLAGQQKLKKASVLVIGAGGLGCPILQYLTAAGVGKIGICDFDFVDASNLQRQILYSISDLGKPKAVIAAERLSQINPYPDFEIHNQMLKKENVLEIFAPYDIIVDGSDNFPTRFLVNDACVILNKPFVFGAIYKFEGQVSVFNYKGGPTYRCLIPDEPPEEEAPSCSQIGVMGVVPGLIGCFQAIEVIKIICQTGKILSGEMLVLDTLNLMQASIEIKRSHLAYSVTKLGDYGDFCRNAFFTIKQIKPLELFELLQNGKAIAIDVRERDVFIQCHIESKNLAISDLLVNRVSLPHAEMLVFVCESGINSMAVIDTLVKSGNLKNLYNLDGGIQAWINQGLPTISTK